MLPVFGSSTCCALRSELNGKYLQAVYRKKDGGSRVEASADSVAGNTRARFLLEPSKEEKGYMHVRCCYNNKYWVALQEQDSGSSRSWIIGTADEPEEDLSSPSRTLFQALPLKDKHKTYRFLHSGLQKFACVVSIGGKTYLQLDDGDDQENKSHNFTVGFLPHEDLPKHVAFKGHNGKYLRAKPLGTGDTVGYITLQIIAPVTLLPTYKIAKSKYVQFYTKNIKDARSIFTTETNDDGTVRIKSNNGAFWRRESDDLISTLLVEPDDKGPDSLFEVFTGDNFVALRNLGNNKFCRSFESYFTLLSACDDSISQGAKLELEEPVHKREISDVKFHLDEARIYDKKIVNAVTSIRTNNTSREAKATFSFTKKVEIERKWVTSVSSKRGVKANFCFNGMPMISGGGHITTSIESTESAAQITSEKSTDEATITEECCIPPRTKVAGKFSAMRASCDVPYSYNQTDVLTTGEVVTTFRNDGIYTVANNYNFQITVTDNEDEIRRLEAQYC